MTSLDWMTYDGIEIASTTRTAALSEENAVDAVWLAPEDVFNLSGTVANDPDVTNAPWYKADVPASAEYLGMIVLSAPAIMESTASASTTELTWDGGATSTLRRASVPIVVSAILIATTDRGAEYGRRWLSGVLERRGGGVRNCAGVDLGFYLYEGPEGDTPAEPPLGYMRDVHLTRGISVTRKRPLSCGYSYTITFTLTADDPMVYGLTVPAVTSAGYTTPGTGPLVGSTSSTTLVNNICPTLDYAPIMDPDNPSLVAPPAVPDVRPAGWAIVPGLNVHRRWVVFSSLREEYPDLEAFNAVVPEVTLSANATVGDPVRNVRISFWGDTSNTAVLCNPLFSVMVTYVPRGGYYTISGSVRSAYFESTGSLAPRRADSVLYGPEGGPVEWDVLPIEDVKGFTIDTFPLVGVATDVSASVSFTPVLI